MGEPGSGIPVAEIAALIDAELVAAPPNLTVTGLASLANAGSRELSFLVSEKHIAAAKQSSARALICPPGTMQANENLALLVHPHPYLAYAIASELFAQNTQEFGVSDLADISPTAEISDDVSIGAYTKIEDGVRIAAGCRIGPGCYIGSKSSLGANTKLYANVTIYHDTEIGSDCRIHSGAVIGSDGFGFAPSDQGWVKIHQLGRVIIGDKVEVGANTSISRGALDDTRIGNGVIIDDLVLIAHNVEIGDHTALAGQAGIAGSTKIGKNCSFGGQVAVTGHIEIADSVHITGKSMVTRSITRAGQYSSGMPVVPSAEWRKNAVRLRQIEKLVERVSTLENTLEKTITDKAKD